MSQAQPSRAATAPDNDLPTHDDVEPTPRRALAEPPGPDYDPAPPSDPPAARAVEPDPEPDAELAAGLAPEAAEASAEVVVAETDPEDAPAEVDEAEEPHEPDTELLPVDTNQGRPTRPPIHESQAEVIERTRPGRIQVLSERFWTVAIVLGIVGVLTALVTHGHAVDELTTQVQTGDPEPVRRAAANILHLGTIGVVLACVIPQAILATFLGGRRVLIRVLLSLLTLVSLGVLRLALDVLGPSGWRGTVIQLCLVGHVILAVVGSVLMWLPIGRRVKKR